MTAISLADAKARLSELVDQAQAGEIVEITRRGKPVALLVPITAARSRIEVADLRQATDGGAVQAESAGDFMRRMRDDYRY
ncbi:MAG: type II toxin-antitoxin system prevent-host-death family antitoxin [Alphaproteobacteria bacterium]|nr:type II toxin-antitoxin system prevent-host-death family antitoxin [Alphaproteobacteria bacterium]MBU2116384.1 type II toxin-antitoxin system prevent-host-death family antitoxin [Alphaproteobacteria bacterium]MBU2351063.1 type II toxin-antitoxin system prevent-host-death family antitoxin [Alphaproteobacteria bacterium]MBU2381431.1 type II toxin-antitoxin system prevent-host-death family antitoxin [Alphaproteobacteria bacterium]